MIIFVPLFVAGLIWMLVTFKARMRVRDCRWREDRSRDTDAGRYFVCLACGAQTHMPDGAPPANCLRRSDAGV